MRLRKIMAIIIFGFFLKKLVIISKISTSNGTNALTFGEEEYNNFSLFFDIF
jgi:hypothetical protein